MRLTTPFAMKQELFRIERARRNLSRDVANVHLTLPKGIVDPN